MILPPGSFLVPLLPGALPYRAAHSMAVSVVGVDNRPVSLQSKQGSLFLASLIATLGRGNERLLIPKSSDCYLPDSWPNSLWDGRLLRSRRLFTVGRTREPLTRKPRWAMNRAKDPAMANSMWYDHVRSSKSRLTLW